MDDGWIAGGGGVFVEGGGDAWGAISTAAAISATAAVSAAATCPAFAAGGPSSIEKAIIAGEAA